MDTGMKQTLPTGSRRSPNFQRIALGDTGLRVPPLGIGTWAWGDRFFWGYGREGYAKEDLEASFAASLAAGVNLFDTAEIYGLGRSERILGSLVRQTRQPALIATKFFPYPWRLFPFQFRRAVRGSLHRLGAAKIDLYQIHWPYPPRSPATWVKALGETVQAGLVRAAGVSNYDLDQTRHARQLLAGAGVPLASNQVEFSLLQRAPERSGLLEFCQASGIAVIAYSPLGQGLLTGKYSAERPPSGVRGRRYGTEVLDRIQPLIALMREIGDRRGGKTAAQVALNWVICKGAIPIPGVKTLAQTEENLGALGWRLEAEEIAALDETSQETPA